MATHFTAADWHFIQTRATTIWTQLKDKGMLLPRFFDSQFIPLPPIDPAQLTAFTAETGLTLPPDFADLVTKFSGGWSFHWDLCVSVSPFQWLKPPVYIAANGGSGESPFIGVSESATLLKTYQNFQSTLKSYYNRTPEQRAIDPALFPLDPADGEGNITVLRLDRDPAEIHFLNHEGGNHLYEQDMIGIGFREFMIAWATLGFPEFSSYDEWVNPKTHQPEDQSPKAKQWLAWLADPTAKTIANS